GDDVSVQIVVQVPAPAGERWNATDATPLPTSVASPSRATVPRRLAPGSVRLTQGAVKSLAAPKPLPGLVVDWLNVAPVASTLEAASRAIRRASATRRSRREFPPL